MQAGGLGGEGEHKQRNESCKHKSAPMEARRVGQDGNPSWGGWKMKKEVGIRFESCRRLTPGQWDRRRVGWGVAYSASRLKRRSQKEGESPQALLVGGRAQAKPRNCRDDSEFQGTHADD